MGKQLLMGIHQRIGRYESVEELANVGFVFNKKNYKILGMSKSSHLIKTEIPKGLLRESKHHQIIVERDDGRQGEAYIYFYTHREGDHRAILDALELDVPDQL